MRTQQQRLSTRIWLWISHDVKRRSDARYCCSHVCKQAQVCHDSMKALFNSDKRCSHTADAADEHMYDWVSSEIRQPARNLNDAKGCAILRLILDRLMRSILLNVTYVDPGANLPVLHPSPCLKHLSRRPFLHGSSRSRSSPVLRNRRLFCRPIEIEAKPGASSSWCWGVHCKRKILYKLKNFSLKSLAARLSGLLFNLSSECRVFRFSRRKREKSKKKTAPLLFFSTAAHSDSAVVYPSFVVQKARNRLTVRYSSLSARCAMLRGINNHLKEPIMCTLLYNSTENRLLECYS